MRKRLIVIALAVVLVSSLVIACASSAPSVAPTSAPSAAPTTAAKPAPVTSTVAAPTTPSKVWTFDLANGAPEDPYAVQLRYFEEMMVQKSGGRIKVNRHHGDLGGELKLLDMVMSRQIAGGSLTFNIMDSVIPEYQLLSLPFLIKSPQDVDKVLAPGSDFSKKLYALAEKKGLKILDMVQWQAKSIATPNKIAHSPADLKGMKLRMPEVPIVSESFQKLGVSVTAMAFTDYVEALRTGVVNGSDDGPVAVKASNIFDQLKAITLTRHTYYAFAQVINLDLWNELPPDLQNIVQTSMHEVCVRRNAEMAPMDADAIKFLKDKGVNIYQPTAEELQSFKTPISEVKTNYAKKIGLPFANELFKLLGEPEVK